MAVLILILHIMAAYKPKQSSGEIEVQPQMDTCWLINLINLIKQFIIISFSQIWT